ncbi:ABC transporter ATP-binding protein [Leucobacter komagatae]|uniref:ABC transporter ATP-binding protein n=1 Tax=Leucobacter komagatae TaxID=55969 RepID=UPI003CCC8C12
MGGRKILQGVSAEFEDGVMTVLIGPSGTGKTTLLNLLAGYLSPSSGSILVNGMPPDPSLVAWIPQGVNALGRRTLTENVMIAPLSEGVVRASARELATHQLERVGLGGREESTASELSGGELQRLAIARALASRKPLLLADEPTANLDSETAGGIIALLHSLRCERTLVVATHDPELMRASERVVSTKAWAKSGAGAEPLAQRGKASQRIG